MTRNEAIKAWEQLRIAALVSSGFGEDWYYCYGYGHCLQEVGWKVQLDHLETYQMGYEDAKGDWDS